MIVKTGLVYSPIRELGDRLRSGRTSPVELTEAFLERLEDLGPKYNSVVTVTRERAESQARRADRKSVV